MGTRHLPLFPRGAAMKRKRATALPEEEVAEPTDAEIQREELALLTDLYEAHFCEVARPAQAHLVQELIGKPPVSLTPSEELAVRAERRALRHKLVGEADV